MRRILLFFIALFALTGCVDSAQTISVLNAADSLVNEQPDSAYRLLQTLDGQRIWQDENEAKYALLLTQAKYKNYIKNESDSLINIAVDYYKTIDNPDMYARALFYLGTVNEDMGDNDAAIENYKAADATITTDTLLLGLVNSRMGWLYSQMSIVEESILRLKKAIDYFTLRCKLNMAGRSAVRLGHIYTTMNIADSAARYLTSAYELGSIINDTALMCYSNSVLVETYRRADQYEKAQKAAWQILNLDVNYSDVELYYSLARLYSQEKSIDSARYYIKKCLDIATYPVDTLRYYFAAMSVCELDKNYEGAFNYMSKANDLENRIQAQDAASKLYETDRRFDKKQLEIEYENLHSLFNFWVVIAILMVFIALMIYVAYIIYKRRRNRERQNYIETLKEQESDFRDTRTNLDIMMNRCLKLENNVRSSLEDRVALTGELINDAYACGNRYDKFAEKFNKMVVKKPLGVDSCRYSRNGQ